MTKRYFYLLCHLFKVEESQASLHANSRESLEKKKLKLQERKKIIYKVRPLRTLFYHEHAPGDLRSYSNILNKGSNINGNTVEIT